MWVCPKSTQFVPYLLPLFAYVSTFEPGDYEISRDYPEKKLNAHKEEYPTLLDNGSDFPDDAHPVELGAGRRPRAVGTGEVREPAGDGGSGRVGDERPSKPAAEVGVGVREPCFGIAFHLCARTARGAPLAF